MRRVEITDAELLAMDGERIFLERRLMEGGIDPALPFQRWRQEPRCLTVFAQLDGPNDYPVFSKDDWFRDTPRTQSLGDGADGRTSAIFTHGEREPTAEEAATARQATLVALVTDLQAARRRSDSTEEQAVYLQQRYWIVPKASG